MTACLIEWCRLPMFHRGRCIRRPIRASRAISPLDRAAAKSARILRQQFDANFSTVMKRLGVTP